MAEGSVPLGTVGFRLPEDSVDAPGFDWPECVLPEDSDGSIPGQSKPGQTESSASGVIPGAGNVIIEGNPENDVIIGPGA